MISFKFYLLCFSATMLAIGVSLAIALFFISSFIKKKKKDLFRF